MALTFYRGNVNLPSGGDPMNAVADALRERRLRQQQLADQDRNRAAALDQQRQVEQMTRARQLEVTDLENRGAMERALATRKDAQAARLEAQRKAAPRIQTQLGKGNADAASAEATAAGIEDFGEIPYGQKDFGDGTMESGENVAPPPDPNAPKKYGFSVGDERQEFALTKPVDNATTASTLDGYAQHSDPEIRKLAETSQSMVRIGKDTPGHALSMISSREAQLQRQKAANSRAHTGKSAASERGDRRLDLSEEAGARAYAKDIASGMGLRDEMGKVRQFTGMASMVSSGNAALDAVAAGSFVKQAQGGTGVLSDSDMNQFWNRLGGWGVRGEEGLSGALSGKMGDDKRKLVGAAVQELARLAMTRVSQMRQQFREGFAQSPNFSKYGKQMESAYFGGMGADGGGGKGDPGAPKAQPKNEDEMIDMVLRMAGGGK